MNRGIHYCMSPTLGFIFYVHFGVCPWLYDRLKLQIYIYLFCQDAVIKSDIPQVMGENELIDPKVI